MTRMSKQGFRFPPDLNSQETSKVVLTIKRRFARDFWMAYSREAARSVALARHEEVYFVYLDAKHFLLSYPYSYLVLHQAKASAA